MTISPLSYLLWVGPGIIHLRSTSLSHKRDHTSSKSPYKKYSDVLWLDAMWPLPLKSNFLPANFHFQRKFLTSTFRLLVDANIDHAVNGGDYLLFHHRYCHWFHCSNAILSWLDIGIRHLMSLSSNYNALTLYERLNGPRFGILWSWCRVLHSSAPVTKKRSFPRSDYHAVRTVLKRARQYSDKIVLHQCTWVT